MIERRSSTHRLLVLCLLAWLNLLLQPCLAQAAAPAVETAHCSHQGDAAGAPCAEMTAAACVAAHDTGVPAAPAHLPVRFDVVVALASSRAAVPVVPDTSAIRGGPPLTIRYCSLRN